jgi:hypothetical protein
MHGQGSATHLLDDATAGDLLGAACAELPLDGKRMLVLIPDGTRNARFRSLFRLLYEHIGARVARLDYLIALGTRPPMPAEAVDRLVGVSAEDRAERYPKVNSFNHAWDRADALTTIGSISAPEVERLTGGLLCEPIPVTLNRMILDYDQLIMCGRCFRMKWSDSRVGQRICSRVLRGRRSSTRVTGWAPSHENVGSAGGAGLFHGRWRVVGPMDSSGGHAAEGPHSGGEADSAREWRVRQ